MCIVERYDPLIRKMAWRCLKKCAKGHITFEDLFQEGRLVMIKLLRKRYKPDAAKFSSLLTTCLINKYSKIVRDSYRKKRINVINFTDHPVELNFESEDDTFDIVHKREILKEIERINPALANLFTDGVPTELLIRARNKSRSIAFRRKQKSHKITFDRKLLEKYYGINLKNLIKILEKLEV